MKLRMLDASCSFKCPGHEELSRLREGIDLGPTSSSGSWESTDRAATDVEENTCESTTEHRLGSSHLILSQSWNSGWFVL